MKRIFSALQVAFATLGFAAIATALLAQPVPQGQSPANPWQIIIGTGHVDSGGALVSVGSCGTNPVFSGNDTVGNVTPGPTATQCVITFAQAFRSNPSCSVDGTNNTPSFVVSPTTLTLTVALPGTNYSWLCVAGAGG